MKIVKINLIRLNVGFLRGKLLNYRSLFTSLSFMTGQFLLDLSRHAEAAEYFVQAAALAPENFEASFNAATTLREVHQMERAEHFYRQTVRIRPNVSAQYESSVIRLNYGQH